MIDIEGFRIFLYEEELSANTVDVYMRGIKMFAEKYSEVTKANVIEFKNELCRQNSPGTVNLRICAIRKYCEFKEINMKIKDIKEPKKTHIDNIITDEQFKRLCDGLKAIGDERHLVWVLMLGKTGMRISEALQIKKKDVLNGCVTIHTKAHMREIYFPKSLVDDIQPFLDSIGDNDIVMQRKDGKPITTRGVAEYLKRAAYKYGIPCEVMHPHSFRHYFAMEFIKRKNDIALLADLLGHGSVNVTQIYLRQSREQQKKVVDDVVNW